MARNTTRSATMSISLAPMLAEQPPAGAETQQALYLRAGERSGTGVGYKAFCERLVARHVKSGGEFDSGSFMRDGRRQTFWWQVKEVAK